MGIRIWHRSWVDRQQKRRSRRQLRNKKKSKWVDGSPSKPCKPCRLRDHDNCEMPDRCPCYCHKIAIINQEEE